MAARHTRGPDAGPPPPTGLHSSIHSHPMAGDAARTGTGDRAADAPQRRRPPPMTMNDDMPTYAPTHMATQNNIIHHNILDVDVDDHAARASQQKCLARLTTSQRAAQHPATQQQQARANATANSASTPREEQWAMSERHHCQLPVGGASGASQSQHPAYRLNSY